MVESLASQLLSYQQEFLALQYLYLEIIMHLSSYDFFSVFKSR